MYCPVCQGSIQDTTVICPKCKKIIPRCPTCKKVIYEKSRFCMDDGTKLPEEAIAVLSNIPDPEMLTIESSTVKKPSGSSQSAKQKRVFIGLTLLLVAAVSVLLGYLIPRGSNETELLESDTSEALETILSADQFSTETTSVRQETTKNDTTEPETTQSESEQPESTETEPSEPMPIENPFADIDESEPYAQHVLWAVEKGIASGMKAHKFYPDKECSRGQFLTFLWRVFGSPEANDIEIPFEDVTEDSYYYEAVLWAIDNGIVTGTKKGRLSLDEPCTRGQAALFIWRAHGSPAPASLENPFRDLDGNVYYYDAVLWVVEQNIANGVGRGKFKPEAACSRSQAATFLYRAFEESVQ